MAPITRILQNHAEEIPCSAIIPPLYYINKQWIALNPHPTPAITPTKLTVDTEPQFRFKTISSIATGGLYTQKEIQQAQDSIMFGIERNALNNILAKKISSSAMSDKPYSVLNLFDTEEIEQLAESTLNHLWGWFQFIGTYTSGVLGLYFICRVFKFVFEVLLNALAIHKTHGCSLQIFASLWDTLTLYVLHRQHLKNLKNNEPPADSGIMLSEPYQLNDLDEPHDLRITVREDGTRTVEPHTTYNDLNDQAHAVPTPYLKPTWL